MPVANAVITSCTPCRPWAIPTVAHVRDFHGWDPETISYLHEHGGLEAEHHAEHVNNNGNVHRASAEIGLCAYTHPGDCAWPGPSMARNGESIRHSRPRGLELDLKELADHHPDRSGALNVVEKPRPHVIRAYKGGYRLGDLHFQQSDDGRAIRVNMLHTMAGQRQGIGSAMMDRLYSHANEQGAWIDHGTRTKAGRGWWNSYREPYPELSTPAAPAGRADRSQLPLTRVVPPGAATSRRPPCPVTCTPTRKRTRSTHSRASTPAATRTTRATRCGTTPGRARWTSPTPCSTSWLSGARVGGFIAGAGRVF